MEKNPLVTPDTNRNDFETRSRRSFLAACAAIGVGAPAAGAFLASCGDRNTGPAPVAEPGKAYLEKVLAILRTVHEREFPLLEKAAMLAVQAKLEGHNLFANMTGGMLGGESRVNRPGAPLVYLREDLKAAVRYDVIVTNNPYAILGLSERLIRIVGITTPSILSKETPEGSLENMGSFRFEDVADTVIYSHVPPEDGLLALPGIDIPIGPVSGIVETFLFHALTSEIAEHLFAEGIYIRIG